MLFSDSCAIICCQKLSHFFRKESFRFASYFAIAIYHLTLSLSTLTFWCKRLFKLRCCQIEAWGQNESILHIHIINIDIKKKVVKLFLRYTYLGQATSVPHPQTKMCTILCVYSCVWHNGFNCQDYQRRETW